MYVMCNREANCNVTSHWPPHGLWSWYLNVMKILINCVSVHEYLHISGEIYFFIWQYILQKQNMSQCHFFPQYRAALMCCVRNVWTASLHLQHEQNAAVRADQVSSVAVSTNSNTWYTNRTFINVTFHQIKLSSCLIWNGLWFTHK